MIDKLHICSKERQRIIYIFNKKEEMKLFYHLLFCRVEKSYFFDFFFAFLSTFMPSRSSSASIDGSQPRKRL